MNSVKYFSANRGDSQDKDIDRENALTNDFLILVCISNSWLLQCIFFLVTFGINFPVKIQVNFLILNLEMELLAFQSLLYFYK